MPTIINSNDPRVKRTRKLIQDAFLGLTHIKSFDAITVRDITEKATVNRATFYAHFEDKNALLESVLTEIFMRFVENRINEKKSLDEDAVRMLILAVCDYHESLCDRCKRNYQSLASLVEAKVQHQLEKIVKGILENDAALAGVEIRKMDAVAVMASWAIYGAAFRWYSEDRLKDAPALADEVIPFVRAGAEAVLK